MNYKRALGLGVLVYVGSFIIGLAACFFVGYDMTAGEPMPDSMYYVGMVAAVVLTYWATRWYLRGRPSYDIVDGGMFGLAIIVIGFILDVIIFGISMGGDISAMKLYYSDARFWITLIIIALTATMTAMCPPRKN